MVNAPFREYVVLFFESMACEWSDAFVECDPNVSVRRIEASFRKFVCMARSVLVPTIRMLGQ